MGNTGMSSEFAEQMMQDDLYEQGKEMKLVPCRWSKTGWKYVEVDPGNHKFFVNPNRANAHGYNSPQKRGRDMDSFRHQQATNEAFKTTNMKFFSADKSPQS